MISVVDDDVSVRRALKRLIRSCGFEVETFASAQDFFAETGLQKAECIILDIHLGGMSGFEMYQKLTNNGSDVPVIFITAHDDEQTRTQAKRLGAVAYLRKPFDDQSLIDAISTAIQKRNE